MNEYEFSSETGILDKGANFIRALSPFHPFSAYYFYIDKEDYFADSLFVKYKLKVRFLGEWSRNDFSEYSILKCKISKKQDVDFQKAMKELHGKMLILNSPTYRKVCSVLDDILQDEMKGSNK